MLKTISEAGLFDLAAEIFCTDDQWWSSVKSKTRNLRDPQLCVASFLVHMHIFWKWNFFQKIWNFFSIFKKSKGGTLWILKNRKKFSNFLKKNFIIKKCAYGPKMKPRQVLGKYFEVYGQLSPITPEAGKKRAPLYNACTII